MESKIASSIDQAVIASDNLLAVIKDYKKYQMSQFLGLGCNAVTADLYKSGFSFGRYNTVKLRDLIQPGGIVAGPADESFFKELYDDAGYPLIVPLHISGLRFKSEKYRYITRDAARNYQPLIVMGGDIILSYLIDDTGASTLVPFMQEESFLGPGLLRIRLNNSLCEVFYILNILHFYYHTGILKMIIVEHGGLNIDSISDLLIPLPAVQAQKEIADKMLRLSAGMEAQEHYHKEMLKLSLLIDNL